MATHLQAWKEALRKRCDAQKDPYCCLFTQQQYVEQQSTHWVLCVQFQMQREIQNSSFLMEVRCNLLPEFLINEYDRNVPISLIYFLEITISPRISITTPDVYYHSPNIKLWVCVFCYRCKLILQNLHVLTWKSVRSGDYEFVPFISHWHTHSAHV